MPEDHISAGRQYFAGLHRRDPNRGRENEMKYTQIVPGRFEKRLNRFAALVELDGRMENCHVKNTGRCQELLVPGAEVWLEKSNNPNRKTAWDLITVRKGETLINMDSQAPNRAVGEWLEQGQNMRQKRENIPFSDITYIKPECRYGSSRIDFYLEAGQDEKRKIFIEVKGVTLEEEGIARFPDAPTERGIKHMLELERAVREGYESYILFVIQMKGIRYFEPNDRTHPAFGETLRQVRKSGVGVLAWDCQVTEDEIRLDEPVEIRL